MSRRILSVLPPLCLIFALLGEEASLARGHVLCVVNKSDDTLSIIDTRTNTVVGTDPDAIGAAVRKILDGDAKKGCVPALWDGRAAARIVDVLERDLENRTGRQRIGS